MLACTFSRATLLALTTVVGAAPANKSVFVSVVDEANKPVTNMAADEFRVREDQADREIVSVKSATDPLQVIVLVDTSDGAGEMTQDIRNAVGGFIQQIHSANPDASISLMEFGQAAVTAIPFSSDDEALKKALNKMVAKPGANSVLLEAILQASNDLAKRPSPRRAIVSLNVEPSNEQSREDLPRRAQDSLRKSQAQYWALSVQSSSINARMSNKSAKAANAIAPHDVVLNAFTKVTGGERQMIVAPSAMPAMLKDYADILTSQYELTYARPSGSGQVLQVGTTRQGTHPHVTGLAQQ